MSRVIWTCANTDTNFYIQYLYLTLETWNTFWFSIDNNRISIKPCNTSEEISTEITNEIEGLISHGLFINIFITWLRTSLRLRKFLLLNNEEYNLLINKDNYTT